MRRLITLALVPLLATTAKAQERSLLGQAIPQAYVAVLEPVNPEITDDRVRGLATFVMDGDEFLAEVDARGLSAGMHLQHLHGFTDSRVATCPTAAADENGDGIIDLTETHDAAGVTLIPLHENPSSLEIKAHTYPDAEGPTGMIDYEEIEELDALRSALREKHGIQSLALERRVIFLHGVPGQTELPASVASLAGVPAQVTLPIACGELVRVGPRR